MTEHTNGARKRSLTEEMRAAETGVPDGPDAGADRDMHTALREGRCRRDTWCIEPAGHGGMCTIAGIRELGPAKVPTKGMATPREKAEKPPDRPWPEVSQQFVDVSDPLRTLCVLEVNKLDPLNRDIVGVVQRCALVDGRPVIEAGDRYSCAKSVFDAIWKPLEVSSKEEP